MSSPGRGLFLVLALAVLAGLGLYTIWYSEAYAYLSDDPKACVNCHIMQDNFHSWSVSAHRDVTCNDCHVPHDFVTKYMAKAEHGFRHSTAFTFGDTQVIHITDKSLADVQHNCVRCHEPMVGSFLEFRGEEGTSCSRCHRGAGHVF